MVSSTETVSACFSMSRVVFFPHMVMLLNLDYTMWYLNTPHLSKLLPSTKHDDSR